MQVKIKYIGMFGDEYTVSTWDEAEMLSIIAYQSLMTKQDVIRYLARIKIHEDSIAGFVKLYKKVKGDMDKGIKEENKLRRKISSKVEKLW